MDCNNMSVADWRKIYKFKYVNGPKPRESMQNKVIFYYNDPSDGLGLDISSARIPQGVYDLMEGNPVTGASNWGKELYLYGDRYQLQSSAVAKDNFSGKDFFSCFRAGFGRWSAFRILQHRQGI